MANDIPTGGSASSRAASDDDLTLTDSTIFAVTTLVGSDLLDAPSVDLAASRMDESQLRLAASVFSNTRDGIMITDAEGLILDINRAFTRITGYVREDVIGKHAGLLRSDAHPPEFYDDISARLKGRGYWRGEVLTRRKGGDHFAELLSISAVQDAFGHLTHYVSIYTDISDLKESQRRLEHLAYHDALTHLPNRTLLADRIEQAINQVARHESSVAVCFLDLDDFKPVNDAYGHEVGDALLIEVARRLKELVRAGDTVARLGGDEFALLLTDLDGPDDARTILERLLETISAPYSVCDVTATISASIGYTLAPQACGDPDALLRQADQAMYVAKLEGRNRCHLFDAENDRKIRTERESVARIEQAIAAGELRLYYQPKVNLRSGAVVGAEALIRWQHPERGLLGPAEFLLPLEHHPIQTRIGAWVIREALRQMSAWQERGIDLSVSVNVAGSHLVSPAFVEELAASLACHPEIAPSSLELEILETVALTDIALVSSIIERCRALGVQFALDDFGTGYSSLVYLKRLPAQTLKIDCSFVRDMLDDPEDLAIVSGIIGLSAAFRRSPVAEGVESPAHGILLLALGCDTAQGFGIARPMPAGQLADWVRSFRPDAAWQDSLHPWCREDFPLLAALCDYRALKAMLDIDEGDAQHERTAALGRRHTGGDRLTRWLAGPGGAHYGELDALAQANEGHRQLLRLRVELTVRHTRGDHSRDGELLQAIRHALVSLIPCLVELRAASGFRSPLPEAAGAR